MTIALGIAVVVLLIAANAFFVAFEFALVVVDRAKVAVGAEAGTRPWPTVQSLISNLSFNLSGAQFGITVSSLLLGQASRPVAGALLTPALRPILGDAAEGAIAVIAVFFIATVLQLVFGELVPKNFAIAEPMRVLKRYGTAAAVYSRVTGPLIGAMNAGAEALVRRMGIEPIDELHSISSIEELEQVIRSSGEEGTLDPQDVTLLTRSIRFGEKRADDALLPRVELRHLFVEQSVADLVDLAVSTGHSRFPVMGHDLDDIRGVAHIKAAHSVALEDRATTPVSAVMREAFVVPEQRDLESILREMRSARNHMAIVVDEHGGTLGIVTAEDIVEEIVGDISDEHDPEPEQLIVHRPAIGEWVLSGSLHRDEVAEACGFVYPDGEYETLAGFALDQLQRIPARGELFQFNGWSVAVAEIDGFRIASLRLSPISEAARAAAMEATGR